MKQTSPENKRALEDSARSCNIDNWWPDLRLPPINLYTVPKLEVAKKFDDNKIDWDLLPLDAAESAIKVLMFGEQKYGRNNWKQLDNFNLRYYNAAMRHLTAWNRGEITDPESGLPHLSHALCCLLFLQQAEIEDAKKIEREVRPESWVLSNGSSIQFSLTTGD